MTESQTGQAALAYRARGWSVIPVEGGGKRPLVRWEEFQHRCADPDEVHTWFRRRPDANVAVVTGAVSGLVVLDVDPRHGGSASLARLESRHGRVPQTVEAETGGGGRHLYFVHPGAVVRNRVGLAPGIDLRGDGGLVVAPPSLHASGRRYRWLAGHGPDEARPALLPGWLLALATGEPARSGHPLSDWRARFRETVPEGGRNDRIASLTGHLLWHGVDPDVIGELLRSWNRLHCRPPLSDAEVERTVQSITRTHFRHEAEREEPRGEPASPHAHRGKPPPRGENEG